MKFNALLFVVAVLILTSCRPLNPSSSTATGDAITRATVRNVSASEQVTLAKPHSDSTGKIHLDTASTDLQNQSKDLAEANSALKKERENCQKIADQFTKLSGKWYVKAGHFIERSFYLLLGLFGLGFVLRLASQFVAGPVGTGLSLASTAIFGVLSGGVSLIQTGFDNLWFRKTGANVGVQH